MRVAREVLFSLALTLGGAVLSSSVAVAMSATPREPVSVGTCPDALNADAVGAIVVVTRDVAEKFPGLTDPAFEPPAESDFVLHAEVPEPNRLIPPGTPVTRDLRPNRLNLETDPSGVIRRITCG